MPRKFMPFAKPTEAKIWYYDDFLTAVQDHHLLTNRPEDWKRLQILHADGLRPAMPEGFGGTPTNAQIEELFRRMKDGKLLICGTADQIKEKANTENFEQAFVRIVKGAAI